MRTKNNLELSRGVVAGLGIALALVLSACDQTPSDFPECVGPAATCPSEEAGPAADAGTDAPPDTSTDAGTETGTDAGADGTAADGSEDTGTG